MKIDLLIRKAILDIGDSPSNLDNLFIYLRLPSLDNRKSYIRLTCGPRNHQLCRKVGRGEGIPHPWEKSNVHQIYECLICVSSKLMPPSELRFLWVYFQHPVQNSVILRMFYHLSIYILSGIKSFLDHLLREFLQCVAYGLHRPSNPLLLAQCFIDLIQDWHRLNINLLPNRLNTLSYDPYRYHYSCDTRDYGSNYRSKIVAISKEPPVAAERFADAVYCVPSANDDHRGKYNCKSISPKRLHLTPPQNLFIAAGRPAGVAACQHWMPHIDRALRSPLSFGSEASS